MKTITVILTPAEYQVFKEAISRYYKDTARYTTIQSLVVNSICNEILTAINEKEREVLAEDTEE